MRDFNLSPTEAKTILQQHQAGTVLHDADLIEYCQAVVDGTFEPETPVENESEIDQAAGRGE